MSHCWCHEVAAIMVMHHLTSLLILPFLIPLLLTFVVLALQIKHQNLVLRPCFLELGPKALFSRESELR